MIILSIYILTMFSWIFQHYLPCYQTCVLSRSFSVSARRFSSSSSSYSPSHVADNYSYYYQHIFCHSCHINAYHSDQMTHRTPSNHHCRWLLDDQQHLSCTDGIFRIR
ncbi:hypothetical protein MIMGU_mgv1a016785mg [Erythranthe guttata]|uniref:Secreted protein n=1 Tax=Erythranthe guttata TaxID=4155 RepID=A0A022Q4N9_ERYGU|nr:hypothetical protein MIMGU_mgv1a016785mg [Erythranthe guttata]